MTLTITESRKVYAGNDATVDFPTTFPYFANTDLIVTLVTTSDGSETIQTLITDYTLAGGSGQTGTVTMVIAPATGENLVIQRNQDYKQETDYSEGGEFLASAHEQALDKIVMLIQQIDDENNRAILLPIDTDLAGLSYPTPVADNLLGWNSTATQIENKLPSSFPVDIDINITAIADDDVLAWDAAAGEWYNVDPNVLVSVPTTIDWLVYTDITTDTNTNLAIKKTYFDDSTAVVAHTLPLLSTTSDGDRIRFTAIADGVKRIREHATDGSTTLTVLFMKNDYVEFVSSGAQWYKVSEHFTGRIDLTVSSNVTINNTSPEEAIFQNVTFTDTTGGWDDVTNDRYDHNALWPTARIRIDCIINVNDDDTRIILKRSGTEIADPIALADGPANGGYYSGVGLTRTVDVSASQYLELRARNEHASNNQIIQSGTKQSRAVILIEEWLL